MGERLSRLQRAAERFGEVGAHGEVARQLIDMPLSQAPAEWRSPLGTLFDEYRKSLQFNRCN